MCDLPLDVGDLSIRRLRHTDFADMCSYYCDESVARYCEWDAMTPDQVAAILVGQGCVVPGDLDVPLILAVELKSAARVIGDCSLTFTKADVKQAEIGYVFHPDDHGRGSATRAVSAVLEYAFASFDLHRIVAQVDVRNERSWRLLERVGMHREARLQRCAFVKGEWIDDYRYAMAQDECLGERGASAP